MRKTFTAFLAVLALSLSLDAHAEEKPYWKWYVDDTVEIAKSPAEISFWAKFAVLAGTTAVAYQFDRDVADEAEKGRSGTKDDLAKAGELLGNGLFVLPASAAGWAYGKLADDPKAQTAAKLVVESFVLSGIAANAVKYTAGRHRPKEGDGPREWGLFEFNSSSVSFPSGHSATAFAWAGVMAGVYGDNPLVPPVAYSLAGLTALSRIYDREHWASDVVAGSLIGYFTAKALVGMHEEDVGLTVIPADGGAVVALTMAF